MATTEEAWGELSLYLHNFIRSKVSHRHIADDLLQDVFERIHKKIHTLSDDKKLQPWVFSITRNVVNDYYHQNRLKNDQASLDFDDELDSIEDEVVEEKSVEKKIEIACTQCSSKLRVPSTYTGSVRCPSCSNVFSAA